MLPHRTDDSSTFPFKEHIVKKVLTFELQGTFTNTNQKCLYIICWITDMSNVAYATDIKQKLNIFKLEV